MPEPSNSVPEGARTMPRGTTGIERMGTLETSGVAVPDQSQQGRPAVNPDWPEGKTVPVPRGQ